MPSGGGEFWFLHSFPSLHFLAVRWCGFFTTTIDAWVVRVRVCVRFPQNLRCMFFRRYPRGGYLVLYD